MKKLNLTAQEKSDVVAFMKALSGETKKLDELLAQACLLGPTAKTARRTRKARTFCPRREGRDRLLVIAGSCCRSCGQTRLVATVRPREAAPHFGGGTGCVSNRDRPRPSHSFSGRGRVRGQLQGLHASFRSSSGLLRWLCFWSVTRRRLFLDRQFGYRDAGHYYYPLNQRVQEEWNQGRWPLWEPEENAGMPLLGNPTAAVLYPGKLVFRRLAVCLGSAGLHRGSFGAGVSRMLVLMRSWGTSWFGSALSALAYAFGAPILFQYCNIIYLIGAAWLPLGVHAVDRWVRLGRRWGLLELAIVLSMQMLGGDPQAAYLLGLAGIGYAAGPGLESSENFS